MRVDMVTYTLTLEILEARNDMGHNFVKMTIDGHVVLLGFEFETKKTGSPLLPMPTDSDDFTSDDSSTIPTDNES